MGSIEQLRTFIIEELSFTGSPDVLTPGYPLIKNKVIDSLGIFQLVTFMEDEFDIEVEDDELTEEHFGDLASMAALIEAQRGA
ncbi:MAG TPA: acyl carrier protein [Actinomycetota bacterium]|nr:acyl carrier protein [Actinomycetota bacterium]